MASNLHIGDRILFYEASSSILQDGIVKEVSPSGKYVKLEVGFYTRWYAIELA